MKPSAVRARIQKEHAALRALLAELAPRVEALSTGVRGEVSGVLELSRHLSTQLAEHVDLEDAILAPALREADAWGPVRADSLLRHHAEQRRQIAELLTSLQGEPGGEELAAKIRDFMDELHRDMDHEDRALLDPELLRDDVVGIRVEGG